MISFLTYQLFKFQPEIADDLALNLQSDIREMIEDFKEQIQFFIDYLTKV